jgi:hypothetical protein
MTPQEIVKEFRNYSTAQQAALISQLSRVMQEELESANGSQQSRQSEKAAAVERLHGALKMDNPPLTKEEVRDVITDYLMEKYS